MRGRQHLVLVGLLLWGSAARAACDLPTVGPTVVAIGGQGDGPTMHVVTGVVGICDPAARSFAVDLPDLHGIETADAQLDLAGFSRRYGVHQIGFVLQSVKAVAAAKGVTVQYAATVDGLDRYQLAYTLYLNAAR